MICGPCCQGGQLNAQANVIETSTGPGLGVEMLRDASKAKHAECKGCDCQHRIGRLNITARPPAEEEPDVPGPG